MRKSEIVYTCDVCGKTRKGNPNGVICHFCGKFMFHNCGCYDTPRKCCGREE